MSIEPYDDNSAADGGPPPPGGLWAAFDFSTTDVVVEPPGEEPPPIDPNDPFAPPARAVTVSNAPAGTVIQSNTFYYNPVGSVVIPPEIHDVTIVGLKRMVTICEGWKRVHIQGTASSYMVGGPRTDGRDGLQIKGSTNNVQPEDITLRYWHVSDIDRSGNPSGHPDGVQIMSGKRITLVDCLMTNVAVQPYFVRNEGAPIGGPVEDITFLRCSSIAGGAEGYYAFRIAGDDEVGKPGRYVPARVKIINCSGDRGVAMDTACVNAGGEIINFVDLS